MNKNLIVALALSMSCPAIAMAASGDRTDGAATPQSRALVSPAPSAVSVSYTIDAATPVTQVGRMTRDGVPSTCATPKAFPGVFNAAALYRHVASVPLFNRNATATCATIVITPDAACDINVFSSAYLGSFDPANIATNYLADSGSSFGIPVSAASFSFEVLVPASASIVVNLNDANPGTATGVACTVQVSSNELFISLPVSLQKFSVD